MTDRQLITTSSTKVANRCKREYLLSIEQGMASLGESVALNWGTVWHEGLRAIWTPEAPWDSELATIAACGTPEWLTLDDVDQIDIDTLLRGYVEYYRPEHEAPIGQLPNIVRLDVEKQYNCSLINPDTGRRSLIWQCAGKLDAICDIGDKQYIVEHKSSSLDISAGSPYWEKLKIDSQCSNYFAGARSLGYDPVGILYDVAKKPRLERLLATPIEKRKYTKPTKAEPESRLYAGQREFDETLDEYRDRLIADVASRPEFYFVRGEVVRLKSESTEAAADNWAIADQIHHCQLTERWPRNTEACQSWGKFCEFWPVCTGSADINDPTRYRCVGAHRELQIRGDHQ